MHFANLRRLSALLLALALTLGTGAQAIGMTGISSKMTMAGAVDALVLDGCGTCKDDDRGMLAGCFAVCGGMAAVLPSVSGDTATAKTSPLTIFSVEMTGQYRPPDPHPPKPIILS
jgi:hypothetical protein